MSCPAVLSPHATGDVSIRARDWQTQLKCAVTDVDELCRLVGLTRDELPLRHTSLIKFKFKVTHSFIARMRQGQRQDPLLLQVLPDDQELDQAVGFSADPLGERAVNPVSGLLHKYHGRVLLIVTGACSIHCRYCFRREFPYEQNNPGTLGWQQAIDYIRCDPSIEEVIFSGGDPLLANDERLASLTYAIADIPHVQRLRVHTRLPITLPARITSPLLQWLTGTRLRAIVVVHCNHAQEINQEVVDALSLLRARGVTLLNQSVLLRGINDNADTLIDLSKALFSSGVLPYYCHRLDRVTGSHHFHVDEAKISDIMRAVHTALPGYLVPAFVCEESGALAKAPLHQSWSTSA